MVFIICLSRYDASDSWYFVDYFTKVLEDNLKAVVKPQYVDQIPKAVKGNVRKVRDLVNARAQMDNTQHVMDELGKCF